MSWKFDENVADNFDYIADTSIPKYRIIQYKTLEITKHYPKNSRILEIGAATGNTIRLLNKNGYENVIGTETSIPMMEKCKDLNVIYSETFPTGFDKFDIIIANWTLHFITDIQKRIQYLDEIFNNLKKGGTFIFSEKVIGDDSDYLDFKRSNFLSEADIESKRNNLKNVLIPLKESFYLNIFKKQGYDRINILDKTYCFRTFELQK